MNQYDIFISYRRDGGQFVAKSIQEELSQQKYNVFLDLESLRSGKFNMQLLGVIAECKDFLLILSPGALDRCCNEDDWVTREVAAALRSGVNIIPVFMDGFQFPKTLPKEIESIRTLPGVHPSTGSLDDFSKDIRAALTSAPNSRKTASAGSEQDIFLCCMKPDGEMAAQMVQKNLVKRGYRVFLDITSCRTGRFARENLRRIRESRDFIILLPPGALDGCDNPEDWRYQACLQAISCGANIVPIMLKGFEFPETIHRDISELRYRNGVPFDVQFWDASLERIISFLHGRPRKSWQKYAIPAAAVVLAVCLIAAAMHVFNKEPDIPPVIPETTAEMTGTPAVMMDVPRGRNVDNVWVYPSVWGNESIRRDSITQIRILDTLKDAPEDAWDVSKARDGSAKAWVEISGDEHILFLAGQNGIQAPKDAAHFFTGFTAVRSLDVSRNFHTEGVTDLSFLFYGCTALETLNADGLDTSSATTLYTMFGDCKALKSLDLSSWNTDRVENLAFMFWRCDSLESLKTEKLATKAATSVRAMFKECIALKSLDMSKWDTSGVTDMGYMFHLCSALESLALENFKTDSAETMPAMFSGCSALKTLDLSKWETGGVTDMSYMFNKCSALQSLNVENFKTDSVKTMYAMFSGCTALQSLDVSRWKTGNVTDMSYMFYNCSSLPQDPGTKQFDYSSIAEDGLKGFATGTAFAS